MRAKFRVNSFQQFTATSRKYELSAVTDDGTPENERYNTATPFGSLSIQIDNPAVADFLEIGKSYYLDFSAAD
jgi:hypothetical protein